MKKIIAVLAALAICIGVFAACGKSGTEPAQTTGKAESTSGDTDENIPVKATEQNLKDLLIELNAVSDELGLDKKYSVYADIADGKIDPALIGSWSNADGSAVYTFTSDGIVKTKTDFYGTKDESEMAFTCITAGGLDIICYDSVMLSYSDDPDAKPTETPVISYDAYKISGDVLYFEVVEDRDPDSSNSNSAVQIMYKMDDKGSIDAAVKANPVNLESFYGTWKDDSDRSITIDENGLTCGNETYKLSVNDKNEIIAKKDGKSTAYKYSLLYTKNYTGEDNRELESESVGLSLYFTGEDEADKPNLLAVMEDWHTEYEYDSWYYTANFRLAE